MGVSAPVLPRRPGAFEACRYKRRRICADIRAVFGHRARMAGQKAGLSANDVRKTLGDTRNNIPRRTRRRSIRQSRAAEKIRQAGAGAAADKCALPGAARNWRDMLRMSHEPHVFFVAVFSDPRYNLLRIYRAAADQQHLYAADNHRARSRRHSA